MVKVDLKKELKHLYNPSAKEPAIVEVPVLNYLMIDGQGDPNGSSQFQNAVETLFGVAYALKFMVKKGAEEIDYGVMPLEGLWWVDNMEEFSVEAKSLWKWTLMIMQPEFITKELVAEAVKKVKDKGDTPGVELLRFESYHEGKVVQIMHLGPFSEEGPTVERLHNFMKDQGYTFGGKHHEIYLSDIRRADPKNWKTVIRQPIAKE